MSNRRKLPHREYVFIGSLLRHGFRLAQKGDYLKYGKGYVIASTKQEDASGIDFFVKMPKDDRMFPVQITQRGTWIHKNFQGSPAEKAEKFVQKSELRIRQKRWRCKESGIAFVLIRDFVGTRTNPQVAWGDIKALRYGIERIKRQHC